MGPFYNLPPPPPPPPSRRQQPSFRLRLFVVRARPLRIHLLYVRTSPRIVDKKCFKKFFFICFSHFTYSNLRKYIPTYAVFDSYRRITQVFLFGRYAAEMALAFVGDAYFFSFFSFVFAPVLLKRGKNRDEIVFFFFLAPLTRRRNRRRFTA